MLVSSRKIGERLRLTPREPLLAGRGAEAFEGQLRQMIRSGHRHLVVDLGSVNAIDSAGIRALVRAHTSVQRLGGTLRLAALGPAVKQVLEVSNLSAVFDTYDTVESAEVASLPWRTINTAIAGTALC